MLTDILCECVKLYGVFVRLYVNTKLNLVFVFNVVALIYEV